MGTQLVDDIHLDRRHRETEHVILVVLVELGGKSSMVRPVKEPTIR